MEPQVKAYLDQAETALAAGLFDDADKFTRQAEAQQKINATKAAATPVVDATKRLDMGSGEEPSAEERSKSVEGSAIKAAYVMQFGKDLDSDIAQIYKELYGTTNYPMLRAMKMADVNRYLRTNHCDPKLEKMVLLAPEQIMAAIVSGVPVSSGTYSIKATQVEAQDTLGGVLVPEEINQEWVQRAPGLTVVRARARKFNTSRDALSFIVRTGGNKKYIGAIRSKQTSESPSAGTYNTNATFGKLAIPVHVNLSKVFVSKSMLEDGGVDMLKDVLMPEYVTEAAITEDRQFLTGTGADEPQGILRDATTGGPWNVDITTQNSGAGAAITFDALVNMPFNLAGQYRQRKNANVAFAFTSTTAGLISQLKDGTGRYLWAEMYGNNAVGNPDTLRGWAYAETEQLPEVAANTYPILFGDWNGYRIVDRIGMSVQRYDDSALADTDSVAFYVRRRYGGQMAEGYRMVAMKVST
jgi:HK97 family phage major capsid protein